MADPSGPQQDTPTELDPSAKRRALLTVAFTLFLDLMGFGIILPVLPYYAEFHGASATAVTMLSTTFSLAQFVMAPILGRISDRFGRRPVMLISILGSVAAALTLGLAGSLVVVFLARAEEWFKKGTTEGLNDSEIQSLIDQRVQARSQKDFSKADEIRHLLEKQGILLEDTSDGTTWKRK